MNKKYLFVIDMINIILRLIISICIIGFVFLMATGHMNLLGTVWYIAPAPFISYWINKKANQLWAFILLHLLLITPYLLLIHNMILLSVYGLYLCILLTEAFIMRLKENKELVNTHMVYILIIIAMYFFSIQLKSNTYQSVFILFSFGYIFLYFINQYIINFSDYFSKYENMKHIPIRQIEVNNHFIFGAFIILCVGVILFITQLPLHNIISWIGENVLKIFVAILYLFLPKKINEVKKVKLDHELGKPPIIPQGHHPILDFLAKTLYYSIIAVIMIGILYGIILLFKKFYWNKTKTMMDKVEFISPFDIKEKNKKEEISFAQKLHRVLFGKSNNEKIRKQYYNAIVTKVDRKQLNKNMTPTQLSELVIGTSDNTELDIQKKNELTKMYEKARYSKQECDKQEVIKVKELVNGKL